MRIICILFSLVITAYSSAQQFTFNKEPKFTANGDSVQFYYSNDYYLVPDSCATIIRYAHFNFDKGYFTGPFKDVLADQPDKVIVQGFYSAEGSKEDSFTLFYPNGIVKARGNFKSNNLYGHWEIFYPNGKPWLGFYAAGNQVFILDAWNQNGIRMVEKGNGEYNGVLSFFHWKGRIKNGLAEGKWAATYAGGSSNEDIIVEHYENGVFKGGKSTMMGPTHAAVMHFVSAHDFEFTNAEFQKTSDMGCSLITHSFINAQYPDGLKGFAAQIANIIGTSLNGIKVSYAPVEIYLEGEVLEEGQVHLHEKSSTDENVSNIILRQLVLLPKMKPALLDGKAVEEKVTLIFRVISGHYSFTYQLIPPPEAAFSVSGK